ncbi:hypothetical protein QZH41_010912 [Actinostola sp. cb2023]|nr:hypothetical protein QZH41_010912 [Actinostola sp. cb2023]
MSEKSEQLPLGLLFKNENVNEEMIDILEELHQKYLPVKKINPDEGDETTEVQERIFFGGDQFTEERARCCTDARSDGDTPYERLEGYISKVEDWHAIRILYQILYDIFYKDHQPMMLEPCTQT